MANFITPLQLGTIREALPALRHGVYGNTGTAGPLPEAASDALQDAFAAQVAGGRIAEGAHRQSHEAQEAAREELARLLRTDPERIALTHHTTDGVNIAALGLRWRPGDVVVTTDVEHAANMLAVGALRLRHGVEVRIARIADADADRAATIVAAEMHGARVRALFASHVSYATGAVLPIRELAEVAHAAGAAVVVDGAQSAGAMHVVPEDLGADFYTVSGQKWLLGPEGTGALWVAPGWEQRLLPGAIGYAGVERTGAEGHFLPRPGARRLEVGNVFGPGLAGWAASMRWLHAIGWEAVWLRTFDLAERALDGLRDTTGVKVLTPARHAGLVSLRVPGMTGSEASAALVRRGFAVRSIPGEWDAVRLSCGFFLEEDEVDRFVAAVADLAAEAPDGG